MTRRLISIVGIVAMLIAFAPELADSLDANPLPSCCDGVMCPMHKVVNGRVLCGMMMTMTEQPGGSFQSCPNIANHFAGALPFLRVARQALVTRWSVAGFAVPASPVVSTVDSDVPCLPPRTFAL